MADALYSSAGATPYLPDDRDFGRFSDHVTVWIDKYIGVANSYEGFKTKFDDNIQVLKTNNPLESEIDDDSMLCADQDMLKKLSDDIYCLKYFSTIEKGLEYIRANPGKRIFFISSGSIGKEVVPQIVDLPQIKGIYIFCGNISAHTGWAGDYVDNISAMLEHQDNLLERLTRDIAEYVEKKGDDYQKKDAKLPARNCYAWAKKLLIRGKMLGDTGLSKLIDRVDKKLNELQSSTECPSDN
jgi:hypothetical protein